LGTEGEKRRASDVSEPSGETQHHAAQGKAFALLTHPDSRHAIGLNQDRSTEEKKSEEKENKKREKRRASDVSEPSGETQHHAAQGKAFALLTHQSSKITLPE
jgi:hypothetical protein